MWLPWIAALIFVSGDSQSQFAGKWQTKSSPVTGQHAFIINIVVNEGKFGGTVVLGNPDGSEIEAEIINPELSENALEFQTKIRNDTFDWRLTLKKGNREGLLHGSIREMVIDERVVKQR